MKASQLIEILKNMPPDANVRYLYDLGCRHDADCVWLAKDGNAYVTDDSQFFNDEDLWPEGAKANHFLGDSKDWTPGEPYNDTKPTNK